MVTDNTNTEPLLQKTLCPNFKQCAKGLWRNFKSSSKKVWINHYCNGLKQTNCVRRVLKHHGRPVAESLLPNGDHLASKKE